jgi:hypothetical protein
MKFKPAPFIYFIIFLLFFFCSISTPNARAQGQIRALKERADTVCKRKNRFVAKVLNQYAINYYVDKHGIITMINFTGDWLKVMRVDVVPMVKKGLNMDEVVGHEVFIYTDRQTVRLLSYLKVR